MLLPLLAVSEGMVHGETTGLGRNKDSLFGKRHTHVYLEGNSITALRVSSVLFQD